MTKPLIVTVKSQTGTPYPNLKVYAFDGTRYTGFNGTTDANGQVTLTLPQDNYHFRADYDGVQFWSSVENACTLPGCESSAVILPGKKGTETVTIDYSYDPLYRLTSADYSTGDFYHYAYDSVGNRLTQESAVSGLPSTVSYQYDNANRLTNAGGVDYTFDANGNLLSDGVNTYAYDSANRLTSVNGTSSYSYNGLGDRLSQTVDGVATNYTLDLNAGLTQVLNDGTNTYTYGLGRISQTNNPTAEYFLGDALGSVRQMTDQSGAVTFAQSYDPYGVIAATNGASHTDYGFTGESQGTSGDSTQLVYLRARYYNPADGRFQSRDTWGGYANQPLSLNRWNYTQSNPVNFTDPSGYIKEGMQAQKADLVLEKLKQYNARIEKDWGYQLIPYGYLYYSGCEWEEGLWSVDQLSTVLSSFKKIRNRLNVSEAKVAKIMGATTFRRVDQIQSWFVDNPVADASPSGLVRLTAGAFGTEWYVVHELGHIFDYQRIEGSLKSQKFIEAFQIPCAWNDVICSYNPSDIDTTDYGRTSVLEDFADTFAVTILFNRLHGDLQSQKRIDIMNDLLSKAVNGN